MSYHLDKKIKRKKKYYIIFGVLVIIVFFYFSKPIERGFSYVASAIFRPVLIAGNSVGKNFSNFGILFSSKKTLKEENENLKIQLEQIQLNLSNYNIVQNENNDLKEILGRKKDGDNLLVSFILAKPNRSLYGTLVIDAGEKDGVVINQRVFALGNIPIGKIAEVYPDSSKVLLYSNPGERTNVVVGGKGVYLDIIGRGGGNFEMILPKDFSIDNGTEVTLPGITPRIVATVLKTLSDPRDTYVKALLVSPVNIQTLKFVEVEK